jgi:hypothetical protein
MPNRFKAKIKARLRELAMTEPELWNLLSAFFSTFTIKHRAHHGPTKRMHWVAIATK